MEIDSVTQIKRCTQCSSSKLISEFNKNCRSDDGYEPICRTCSKVNNAILRAQPCYNSYKNTKVRAKSVGIHFDKAIFETYSSFYRTFKEQIDYLHNQDRNSPIQVVRIDKTKPFIFSNIGFDYESGGCKQAISDGHLRKKPVAVVIEEQQVNPITPAPDQDPRNRSLRYSIDNCVLVAKFEHDADDETLVILQKIKRLLSKGYTHELILKCFDDMLLESQIDKMLAKLKV